MAITLAPQTKQQALSSIRRYALEELELDIGDLKAGGLLEFFLKEIGPSVYNRAIADAQGYLQERVMDLEGVCFEKEFAFWTAPATERRRPPSDDVTGT
jgi:uncharacterized protein (DUF2164 family)